MIMSCTIFPYKRTHEATWVSPDYTTEKRIKFQEVNERCGTKERCHRWSSLPDCGQDEAKAKKAEVK